MFRLKRETRQAWKIPSNFHFQQIASATTLLPMRHFHNVALVGFMGTGKSTVGNVLASMLHLRFVDTDALIEQRAGKRITDIFAADGEARFREIESEIVRELEVTRGCVISTGGGVVMNPANMESLKKHALVVCLWASPEAILLRVGHQTHRPLLQGADRLDKIKALLAKREPFYRQADVLLNCEQRSPREVAQHVAHQFRLEQPPRPVRAE
jgi:shikimate kinase